MAGLESGVQYRVPVRREDESWDVYGEVLRRMRERGIPSAIGGGLAVSLYVPQRVSTKDVDLYVKPCDREAAIEVVTECGLKDYHDVNPYDRHWIYRSHDGDGTIVDIMWSMPNRRANVDDAWLDRGPEMKISGERVRALPPEELIWAKLYVLQRDRSDWPDILNILYVTAPTLDWDHLIQRVGPDAPLIEALLSIFQWLCPSRAAQLPSSVRQRLKQARQSPGSGIAHDDLLDTRPWFLPKLEQERKAC